MKERAIPFPKGDFVANSLVISFTLISFKGTGNSPNPFTIIPSNQHNKTNNKNKYQAGFVKNGFSHEKAPV
jgi:hypothetical protein